MFASIVVCTCIVACSLPAEGWRMVRANCYRLDGSWSENRYRRERAAILNYLTTILVPILLVGSTVFVGATLIFTHVMPAGLIVRSVKDFNIDPAVWRENLKDERAEYTAFQKQRGIEGERAQKIQSGLWHGWPVYAGVALLLGTCATLGFVRCARAGVIELAAGIRKRRSVYARGDVFRMARAAEEAMQSEFEGPASDDPDKDEPQAV